MSSDLKAVSSLLTRAGLNITTTPRIRDEIWNKLMGRKVMSEVRTVGEALGTRFSITVAERLEQSRHFGAVRTSMLQDLLGGKPLEIIPLVGMVVALGRLTAVATPVSETIFSLVSQLDRENRRGA